MIPAGTYWVGDPCYGVPDEDWNDWLDDAGIANRYMSAEVRGHLVVAHGTAHGDGCYFDQQGRAYPVDAGLIGVVPVGLVRGTPFGMNKVTFDEPFDITYADGTITIGDIVIETDW